MARPTKQQQINKRISIAMRKDQEVKVLKLKESAIIGASVIEQCYFANISKSTYYRWMDETPELWDELERLRKGRVRLKARQNVVASIEGGDVDMSWAYLQKTDEDMNKTKLEIVDPLDNEEVENQEEIALLRDFREKAKELIKKRILKNENRK